MIIAYDKNGNPKPVSRRASAATTPRFQGGRASWDSTDSFPTSTWLMQPPADYDNNWALVNLDAKMLNYLSPTRLMRILADFSPEVSRALWDFLRMCNPGYDVKAYKIGGQTEDATASKYLDAFIKGIRKQSGGINIVVGELFMGPFVCGAIASELVLDERGRIPLDIATPNPASIRYRRKSDPVLGQIWQPGQWQGGEFKALDTPTFWCIPIDKMPSDPYGRAIAAPAVFTGIFLLGLLHDLKRVIQQQGYPRIDISVDVKQLQEMIPTLGQNPAEFQEFTRAIIDQVESAYQQLQPDDAFIHTSNVIVNRPVGAADASSLGGIDGIITMLERMSVRALKTNSMMLDVPDSSTESEANRKWEIYVAGIKSIQHYVEDMLEDMFELALRVQGIQAEVEFKFAELRASEELRDAQTETMKISNAKAKVDAGWVTNDEASEEITGHKANGTVKLEPATQPQIMQDNGDGQEQLSGNNAMWIDEIREARVLVADTLERINLNGWHEQ